MTERNNELNYDSDDFNFFYKLHDYDVAPPNYTEEQKCRLKTMSKEYYKEGLKSKGKVSLYIITVAISTLGEILEEDVYNSLCKGLGNEMSNMIEYELSSIKKTDMDSDKKEDLIYDIKEQIFKDRRYNRLPLNCNCLVAPNI